MGKKAVFYLAVKEGIDHVAAPVYNSISVLAELKDIEIMVDGYPVKEYIDSETNTFWFVRTNRVVCHDYKTYLPIMLKYFTNFDAAGLVTWHEGDNSPDQVFSVHTTGDVDSANYGPANPQYIHNLLTSMERIRLEEGLENYSITTEATHWSGVMYGDSSPDLIIEYPVPIMDIEIGSSPQNWSDEKAAIVLAKTLFEIFKDDGLKLKNILCAGGTHFDRAFSSEVLHTWDGQAYGISHIIPNQWLVTGGYDGEGGMTKLRECVESISGGIQGIAMHDGLKGAFKEKLRELGREYGVPVFKHQQLRKPDVIIWPIRNNIL